MNHKTLGAATEAARASVILFLCVQEIQQLRTQIVSVEAQLRSALSPNYSPHDRDRALHDQNVSIARFPLLFNLQTKSCEHLISESEIG